MKLLTQDEVDEIREALIDAKTKIAAVREALFRAVDTIAPGESAETFVLRLAILFEKLADESDLQKAKGDK